MQKEPQIKSGLNRTGILMSPADAAKTAEGALKLTTLTSGDASAIAQNRIRYKLEADPLGTIPLPTSIKGMTSAVIENMVFGHHIFLDKLGERIAFERTGSRLYEALLSKYHGTQDKEKLPPLERLEQFYLEERKHFEMASEVMVKIGGDPTAMTPSADVCGIAGMGWIQVIADPRTTFLQSLETILQAELVDNACWEVLIELADNLGLKYAVELFEIALEEESIHLDSVKRWVRELNLEGQVSTETRV